MSARVILKGQELTTIEKFNEVIGNLGSLSTEDKSSLVNAINSIASAGSSNEFDLSSFLGLMKPKAGDNNIVCFNDAVYEPSKVYLIERGAILGYRNAEGVATISSLNQYVNYDLNGLRLISFSKTTDFLSSPGGCLCSFVEISSNKPSSYITAIKAYNWKCLYLEYWSRENSDSNWLFGNVLTENQIVDNLNAQTSYKVLSARQGKLLNDRLTSLEEKVATLTGGQ